jgi:hypothetical protein
VGDIAFDDVIDLVEEKATSEALAMAGVGGNLLTRDQAWSEKLVRGPIRYAVQLRIACLIITLIGGCKFGDGRCFCHAAILASATGLGSEGSHLRGANRGAKKTACSPVPLEISNTVPVGGKTC